MYHPASAEVIVEPPQGQGQGDAYPETMENVLLAQIDQQDNITFNCQDADDLTVSDGQHRIRSSHADDEVAKAAAIHPTPAPLSPGRQQHQIEARQAGDPTLCALRNYVLK